MVDRHGYHGTPHLAMQHEHLGATAGTHYSVESLRAFGSLDLYLAYNTPQGAPVFCTRDWRLEACVPHHPWTWRSMRMGRRCETPIAWQLRRGQGLRHSSGTKRSACSEPTDIMQLYVGTESRTQRSVPRRGSVLLTGIPRSGNYSGSADPT